MNQNDFHTDYADELVRYTPVPSSKPVRQKLDPKAALPECGKSDTTARNGDRQTAQRVQLLPRAPISELDKAKLRTAIKPIVLEMHNRGWRSVSVEFIGGIATMTAR